MPLSLRSVLPTSFPMASLAAAPRCMSDFCHRPPSLWQRWWARNEGTWLEENWYCSSECFEDGLGQRLEQVSASGPRPARQTKRLPLGLVMLSQAEITAEQLRQALSLQRSVGNGRIGEWLVRMGAVTEEQVINALAAQQGCPVFAPRMVQSLPATMHWPQPLSGDYRAVPVFYSEAQSSLYVGFLETVDHGLLYSVEQMLRCRTEPCIVPASVYVQNLERPLPPGSSETIAINQRLSSFEVARAVSNYAQHVGARRCMMTRCSHHLWVRLECSTGFHVDFHFRSPEASQVLGACQPLC